MSKKEMIILYNLFVILGWKRLSNICYKLQTYIYKDIKQRMVTLNKSKFKNFHEEKMHIQNEETNTKLVKTCNL